VKLRLPWASTRDSGIGLLASLINMGAMCAFLVLHVSVVVHYLRRGRGSLNIVQHVLQHMVMPALGFAILVAVIVNAKIAAQRTCGIWIGVGIVVLIGLHLAGRSPALAGSTDFTPAADIPGQRPSVDGTESAPLDGTADAPEQADAPAETPAPAMAETSVPAEGPEVAAAPDQDAAAEREQV